MININKFDFLSPPITLFHLERRTHTSKVGGFLVILMILIIVIYISLLFYDLISHKKITAIFHKKFEFEAGFYSFNSSSIFHFIQIYSPENGGYFDKYDSQYIRTYTTYVRTNFSYENLDLYDHWVFDTCRKNIDDKGLEPYLFDNIENFTNAVCIRYYYNSTERQYYKLEEKGFLWPYLEHGTAQKNNIYLTTITEKCSNHSIMNNILGNCAPQKDIDDYLSKYFAFYFYFTDMQVDPTNFSNPVQKYIQVISTGIGNSNIFVENYLHFSPLRVKTIIGSIVGTSNDINSFFFDFNRKGAANNNEKNFIIAKYYHLMENTVQIYERKYNNILDIISEIGGEIQFIFYIFYWINFSYNKYIIAYDRNSLFFSFRGENSNNEECKNFKFNHFRKKSLKNIPSIPDEINSNLNSKIKMQNFLESEGGKENGKYKFSDKYLKKLDIPSQTSKRFNTYYNNSNILLQEKSLVENMKNINNSIVEELKSKNNNNSKKEKKISDDDLLNRMPLSKKHLDKIDHKKKKSIQITDLKLKSIKYFSYYDFLKSLIFKKEKEKHNFIIIFRKHLLSEEHLFKSHIKIIFLEKQHNITGEEKTNALECFKEL